MIKKRYSSKKTKGEFPFSIGERVECIANVGSSVYLTIGEHYIVEGRSSLGNVMVNGRPHYPENFRRIK